MALDGITTACITYELNNSLSGGRIAKIAQPEPDELLLTIKTREKALRLSLSASPSLPFAYITTQNKPSPMTAPNFCMLLRKHVGNGKILSVTQPGLERIVDFEIEHLDELGDMRKKHLILELMGKHSNLIFCREDGTIIDAIRHVSGQISSVREVLPGREYFIPDTMNKLNPLDISYKDFKEKLVSTPALMSKALYSSFTGISPVCAEDICSLAGISSEITPKDLDEDRFLHLYKQFSFYMEQIQEHRFSPCIYYQNGEPKDFSAFSISHFTAYEKKEFSSISQVLFEFYETKNTLTRIRQRSTDLRHVVTTALERNRKKYDLQSKQLKDTLKRDKYRIYGELLTAYAYDIPAKATSYPVLNYYDNTNVTIPLDPAKSPQENAQKYFEKYNKLKRTNEALTSLLQETKDTISHLESILTSIEMARAEEDLIQIREELIATGYIKKRGSKKKIRSKSKPYHYITSDGYDLYVGKNNLQNDELTFHFANNGDWWFHAKEIPGSHVILKTHGEKDLPDRVFEEAASLAAYYSSGRKNSKVEIDYVIKKEVKKPSGGKPGFVIYHTNYSMVVAPDISSLTLQ